MALKFKGGIIIFIFLSIIMFLLSCKNSNPSYEDINGEWSIIEAKRNGRITRTLENVYFKFDSTPKMQTNILGEDQSYPINYDFPSIEIESSQLNKLNVISLVEDTLILSTRIDKFKYDLELLRIE